MDAGKHYEPLVVAKALARFENDVAPFDRAKWMEGVYDIERRRMPMSVEKLHAILMYRKGVVLLLPEEMAVLYVNRALDLFGEH